MSHASSQIPAITHTPQVNRRTTQLPSAASLSRIRSGPIVSFEFDVPVQIDDVIVSSVTARLRQARHGVVRVFLQIGRLIEEGSGGPLLDLGETLSAQRVVHGVAILSRTLCQTRCMESA